MSETLLKRLSEAGAKPEDAILLVGHGSRLSMNATAVDKHAWYVSQHGYPTVGYGFVSNNEPGIRASLSELVSKGTERIVVLPVFMYKSKIVVRDIPRIVEECSPGVPVVFAEPLETDELLLNDLDRKIPDGW